MKFYSFEEIGQRGDCAQFAADYYGCKITAGRCAATWRGGDNPNTVSIDKDQWYDHKTKTGGGIIQLAAHKFGGDIQQAQQFLGDLFGLVPKKQSKIILTGPSKYEELLTAGYKETARYYYKDMSGHTVHFTVRMDHPDHKKQYIQGTPHGWGMGLTTPILYNLQALAAASWCCIVEGEKCADALAGVGIVATTCAMGARKWNAGYAEFFRGKAVAIMPDNDDEGRAHARMIAASIIGVASTVKIVPTSSRPKGDVADYIAEGHDAGGIIELIAMAPEVMSADVAAIDVPEPETEDIKAAKAANEIPLANFVAKKLPNSAERRSRNPDGDVVRDARIIQDIIDDVHRRFLGFPRRVGGQLFDHDRDTGEIHQMHGPSHLFAWIGRKSKRRVDWTRGDSFVTKEELFAGLMADSTSYEAISHVPDFPRRTDVYYAHTTMPRPCPDHSRFKTFCDFFAPATDEDAVFLRAFICAPLWYVRNIPKPSWIIDSEHGAGTGKSTIAEIVAQLYYGAPIRTNRQELKMGVQELVKRLVSTEGRLARILLVDNVTGSFSCPELADLITAHTVSGRAPYGRGEEKRPNNLVYVITANSAQVDNDIADRSYHIMVRRPEKSQGWKTRVMAYLEAHQLEIISDIMDMLTNHHPFAGIESQTRFPEFEATILQAQCRDAEQFMAAIEHLRACRMEANVEGDLGLQIEEMIREKLEAKKLDPDTDTVFIRTDVVDMWLREVEGLKDHLVRQVQVVRNLAKNGALKMVHPEIKRWPLSSRKEERRSGILWNYQPDFDAYWITPKGRNDYEVSRP